MSIIKVFEKDLPAALLDVIHLAEYSSEQKKKYKNKILKMPLEDILDSLEDYLTKLPVSTERNITVSDRITVVNCRDIFLGISIIFELRIKSIYDISKRKISEKESNLKKRALNIEAEAVPRKPRAHKPIAKITLEEPIFIDLTQNERFLFEDPTEISQQGEGGGTSLVPTVEDGLRAELSRESRSEIELQEKNWPVLEEFVKPIYESIRKHQQMLQESRVQVTDLSAMPLLEEGVTDLSIHPMPEEVREEIVPKSGLDASVNDRLPQQANEMVPGEEGTAGPENLIKRRSSYKTNYIENPRMTNEEYRKFITRRKKATGKAYENIEELMRKKFKHLEEREEELNSDDELYHWDSWIPEVKVPAPAYEMGMVFRIPSSADLANEKYIPKFELLQRSPVRGSAREPPPEQDLLFLDSLRDSVFGMAGLRISGVVPPEAGDRDMQVEGGDLLPAPRVPIEPRTSILQQLPRPSSIVPQVEGGDLLPAPRVPIEPRTSLLQQLPRPSSIVPQLEEIRERSGGKEPPEISGLQSVGSPLSSLLQRQGLPEGSPSLQSPPFYVSQDTVLEKLTELCRPEVYFTTNFLSLCALSESRLIAASIFQHVINLCGQKKVLLTQTGSHPSEILIKLNHNWSFLI